jgi:flagellar motility protein MotE (MotC chaperone)
MTGGKVWNPVRRRPAAPKATRVRANRQHVLLVVACLLAGSGVIRIGEGAGRALALTAEGSEAPAPGDASTEPASCGPPDGGTAELLAAIRARNETLDAREARIADQESALALAGTEIAAQMKALAAAEEDLSRTVDIADTAADDDVARLVSVYESMKPKDAAALFAEMAPEFAAGFLGRMRPDAAGPILAGLDPKAAYTISVMLAGRNAAAPKN